MFFLFVTHVLLLGVMPILAFSGTIYRSDFKDIFLTQFPEWFYLIILIAAIPAVFYFLGYSFFLGQFYMDRVEPFFGRDRRKTFDYTVMVLGPFFYLGYLYLVKRDALLPAAAYTGILTIVSQHLMLHTVSWIDHIKRLKQGAPGIKLRFLFLSFSVLLFLCLGIGVLSGAVLMVGDRLEVAIFLTVVLMSSLASARFFAAHRREIFNIYNGQTG